MILPLSLSDGSITRREINDFVIRSRARFVRARRTHIYQYINKISIRSL